MQITLTRRTRRNQMRCLRPDGSIERLDLGPRVPYHDLAHFVVERHWQLREGFFGNIERGCTLAQLSDTSFIRGLGPQSMQAEILARALQSLVSGACTPGEFAELCRGELTGLGMATPGIEASDIAAIEAHYCELVHRYRALTDGQSLTLSFDPPVTQAAAS